MDNGDKAGVFCSGEFESLRAQRLRRRSVSEFVLAAPLVSSRCIFLSLVSNDQIYLIAFDGNAAKILWRRRLQGYPPCYWSAGVTWKDYLVAFDHGEMSVIEDVSGNVVRLLDLGDDWLAVSPAKVVDDVVFVGNAHGVVCAISLHEKRVLWEISNEGKLTYAPPVFAADRLVYWSCGQPSVVKAVTLEGSVKWRSKFDGTTRGVCGTDGEHLFLKVLNGGGIDLIALDLDSGGVSWSEEVGVVEGVEEAYYDESGVVVTDGLVIHAFLPNCVEARRADNGKVVWRSGMEGACISSPVTDGRCLLVACTNGLVYLFDVRNGKEKSVFRLDGRLRSTPALTREGALVVAEEGDIWRVQ